LEGNSGKANVHAALARKTLNNGDGFVGLANCPIEMLNGRYQRGILAWCKSSQKPPVVLGNDESSLADAAADRRMSKGTSIERAKTSSDLKSERQNVC